MISLILAESSLELVPENLQTHASVISHAQKLKKNPSEILLDNSWHFAAMKGMNNEIKRGRPDLVHFCILEATTIPLYQKNKIKIYVHTIDDNVIYFGDLHMEIKNPIIEIGDYTPREACAILRITSPTLYKLMDAGKLKSYKIGRARRITWASMNQLRSDNRK